MNNDVTMNKYNNLIKRLFECLKNAEKLKMQAFQDYISLTGTTDKANAELRRNEWLTYNAVATMLTGLLKEEGVT